MKGQELIKKYIEFYRKHGHKEIKSAPLIPEHDPTVLFTTAGMHPLVPYLMGEKHPKGTRLVDVQKCVRTGDIDEVGDVTHHTFFLMLGNWSFGDYFKEEAIEFSFELLTSKEWLNIPLNRLAFTCFKGDKDAPKDEEAAKIWQKLGVPKERIAFLPKKDNWWGPAGETGPCGPDTEMFYWASKKKAPIKFDTEDSNWVEIWNDVFMQYNKQKDGKFLPMEKKNVDTGFGVERVAAVMQGFDDNYRTEMFWPIIEKIQELSGKKYEDNLKAFRVIADHTRAAVFILGDERGVVPGKVDQGYILRRFIRRVVRNAKVLEIPENVDINFELAKIVIKIYKGMFKILKQKESYILDELKKEEDKFEKTLDKGLKEFEKMVAKDNQITAVEAFLLFQSYGFPIEIIQELAEEKGVPIDVKGFNKEFEKHQELSRKGAENKFKGGLSEASDITKKLHTATHLLGSALRKVLKDNDIKQKGSNITPERLRYDFNFDRKLTDDEKKEVEKIINDVISKAIPIERMEMTFKEAKEMGAQAEFEGKYNEKVSVYKIGDFSLEVCGGPHVENTKELGSFKIKKEQSSASGIRRIKAVLK